MLRRNITSLLGLAAVLLAAQASARFATADEGFVLSDDNCYVSGNSGYLTDDGEVLDGGFGGYVGACRPWQYGSPDLFYNFFTQGNCNAANAQMYMAPHDVPPLVGHTYYTYQPLYPHEYLYKHERRYHRYYDGGRGLNRTHVKWYYPPVYRTAQSLYGYLRIPR
ncbi:MAG: hypothetical protein R3C99_21660 [Pirellulaceae bacterium]|nr:hypothetical protein [Planctomycetales bacterium]MCA9163593.1 hypothetical protein [Planctomycetales bacterium]MCA9204397.1 hypothetical protein [Planctomycetales bacterium]MCA9220480.1 hypothetical protein [Planctomycetales bacterium]MCA9226047.1 hypothetical protein [Planctomycetales bacterium]